MALEGMVPVWMQTPPHQVAALDQGDAPAELGRRDRGLLPRGAGTDHDEVVVRHAGKSGAVALARWTVGPCPRQ